MSLLKDELPDKSHRSKKDANRECASRVQRTFGRRLKEHGPSTTDCIHQLMEWPEDVHPSVLGVAVYALAREGLIEQEGVEVSERRENRGRLVRRWRLTESGRGRDWQTTDSPVDVREAVSELVSREGN